MRSAPTGIVRGLSQAPKTEKTKPKASLMTALKTGSPRKAALKALRAEQTRGLVDEFKALGQDLKDLKGKGLLKVIPKSEPSNRALVSTHSLRSSPSLYHCLDGDLHSALAQPAHGPRTALI